MKRVLGIFLFSAALSVAATGAVNEISVQNSDTLNSRTLLKVDRFNLEIISPSSGVQFYRDGIVFLYNTKTEAKMLESHTSFGATEAYYAVYQDSSVSNQILFSTTFSWVVPCDAMTFSNDYSIMYYTKRPSNKEPEKIFQAKYQQTKNGKHEWVSDSKPISFCTDKVIYSHPALSADGEKMIFTSNRSESIGGLDLFISYKEGSGWSAPINLGNLINTRGNEMSPFLDQDNNLFFSSDGISGFGGYDIYMCSYNGRGWDKPANLTQMINTSDDELAFTLSRLDGKSAFFTTRVKAGNRSPQLFKVTFRDQPALKKLTNLSNAFKYIAQAGLLPAEEVIPVTEKQAEVIPSVKETVKEPVKPKTVPEVKQETAQLPAEKPAIQTSDEIIYRIQFLSSSKPSGRNNITIGGRTYKTFEYLFNGTYKSCVGEFTSPVTANNLEILMKKEGYPDAFIVAFRNNERMTGSIQSIAKAGVQTVQKQVAEPAQSQKLSEAKKEPATLPVEQAAPAADAIVYRVQFKANIKPKGSYEITIGGKKYKTFEYLYNRAYLSCAGEFSTSGLAVSLQKQLKQEGYPDAFIITTKGKERVTDPALIRK